MTTKPEDTAKTLTELVATEIRVAMARADMKPAELARAIGRTDQWLSVRLRGKQTITIGDLALIARALAVEARSLIPERWLSARLGGQQSTTIDDLAEIAQGLGVDLRTLIPTSDESFPTRPTAHRPKPTSPRPRPRPKPTKLSSLVA
jgi:transcriptional regulator with XRE-family HTH domain